MRVIEYRGVPQPTPFLVVVLGGFQAKFDAATRLNGRRACIASVPDTVDDLALTVRLAAFEGMIARIDPGQLIGYADSVPMIPAHAAPPVAVAFTVDDDDDGEIDGPRDLPAAIQSVLMNGWRREDAYGLGGVGDEPDWGPGGGFSESSGLTVAQMAVCLAPPEWEEVHTRFWPWEVSGWTPPLDFTAPGVPPKVKPDAAAPASEPEGDDPPAADGLPVVPPPAVVVTPADLSDWSPADVSASRIRLAELDAEHGAPVVLQRAVFHLKKVAPTRKFTNEVLAALRG